MKGIEPAMVTDRNRESCEMSEKEKKSFGGSFLRFSFISRFPSGVSGQFARTGAWDVNRN